MSAGKLPLSELPGTEGASRAGTGKRDRQRRRRRRRTTIVLLVALAVFGAASYAVFGFARPLVEGYLEPKDYEGPGTGSVEVQIQAGDSGRAIGRTLEEADVVKTAGAFVDAYNAEPRAASLQPGTYEVRQQMAASDALARLLDPAARVSLRAVVPEGLKVEETLERLTEATGIPVADFEAAAADPASIGLPPEAGGSMEGYLFPATYEFAPDVTATEVLSAMVQRYDTAMNEVGVPPERRREVLVKASLVEAEARQDEDFGRVARVLENRLAAGMALQLDSTVNYATGKTGITTTPEDRETDSPYNTYRYPGLPPGPINSPGEAALAAVLNPTPGDWMYFVAVNPETGETRFAVTAEEHAANVELFRQWLRENGG